MTHLIYIPGLGDGYDSVRRAALGKWRRPGLDVEFIPMNWDDAEEKYEAKTKRIDDAISNIPADEDIVLVGESAGGAVAIGIGLSDPRIRRIVTLCGMNQGVGRVGASLYQKHPAFRRAMIVAEQAAEESTPQQRARVVTVYSPYDGTVRPRDTILKDATPLKLYIPGHLLTILMCLTLLRRIIIKKVQ